MRKIKCVVCGSDMIINLESPAKSYGIDEDGSLYRVYNNDDKSYLEAVCSNDSEHDNLSNNDELVLWLEDSSEEISTILNLDSVIKKDNA